MKCKGLVKYTDFEGDLMLTYVTDAGCSDWAVFNRTVDQWKKWMGDPPDYFIADGGGDIHKSTFLLPEEYLK